MFLVGAAPTFAAEQSVTISPGESVTIELRGSEVKLIKRAPAEPISDYEAEALREMEMMDIPPGATTVPPQGVFKGEFPVDPPKPAAGVVQFTFRRVPGMNRGAAEHSMLTIANGYATGLRYRATMTVNGRSLPTDVCGVLSSRMGQEHWPYPIESIELTNVRVEDFDGADPNCE